MRQYDLILGFLQQIRPKLAEYPELNMFYYPVESNQLLCVYRTADLPQPVPLEFRSYLLNTRLKAKELFYQAEDVEYLSYPHPPLDTSSNYHHIVIDLILAALGGHLPRAYPKETTSLVICCNIPEQISAASNRLRDLVGILILFADEESFPRENHGLLAETLKKEFKIYFEETGNFAIRELDFFLTSLLNQDERIQDNQNRALGFMTHMVIHRFRNFRQVAEFIAAEFPTAKEVDSDPEFYEKKIRSMESQLKRAQRLEEQMQFIGQPAQKARITVREVVEVLDYVYSEIKEELANSAVLEKEYDNSILSEYIIAPETMLEEVFYNHLENMLRHINQPEVSDKRLTVRIYSEARYIAVELINYGPPLSPDILEDLQRTVRVRRPSGSGLGMFLTAMIMRHVGGDLKVTSPPTNSNVGVCVTLKFPQS
jgi:signal transduction histidine kinase